MAARCCVQCGKELEGFELEWNWDNCYDCATREHLKKEAAKVGQQVIAKRVAESFIALRNEKYQNKRDTFLRMEMLIELLISVIAAERNISVDNLLKAIEEISTKRFKS